MIRLMLKSAFVLGLATFVVSSGQTARDGEAGFDMFGALAGVREAMADIGGFCERAPRACVAGRDFVAFAGERIEDGARLAYAMIENRMGESRSSQADASLPDAAIDPVATGALFPSGMPRPYTPPVRREIADGPTDSPASRSTVGARLPIPEARPAT